MAFATPIIMGLSAIGTGLQVYSTVQQSRDAEAAAKYNAAQAESAAKTKNLDDRENALRNQERHRKYLASRRAMLLEKGNGVIEGGDETFLNEEVGNLELRVLDQSVASQRSQAAYQNEAFGFNFQAEQERRARPLSTAATALSGFNSIAQTAVSQGLFRGAYGSGKATKPTTN